MTKVLYLLCIHPVINKRVDHCIRHCQPIERQVHVLNIAWLGDRIVVVHQDEEPMIWEPTDAEDSYDNHEHFYDLRTEMCFSNAFFMGIMGRWKTRSQKNKKKERKKENTHTHMTSIKFMVLNFNKRTSGIWLTHCSAV